MTPSELQTSRLPRYRAGPDLLTFKEIFMSGQYPDRIRQLPLYDGRFDAYKLEAKGADVLFASYTAGTSIPPHTHDTDNYGVITRGELILTQNGVTTRHGVGDWYHVAAHVEHAARFEVPTDEVEFWFRP